MSSVLQVSSGALLQTTVLLDVFLTVLYARAGTGIFSEFVCSWTWVFLRGGLRLLGRRGEALLGVCGPTIVLVLFGFWALLLTVGAALIFHPYLGSAIVVTNGETPRDFVSALYAAGNSMSIVGSSGFSPQSSAFRIVFLINSIVGTSVISLTLTYLMQIYNALQRRNVIGLHLFMLSGMTGNSAETLVRIAPQGRFDSGYSTISDLASSITQLKEMHHFYPVLLYFRFGDPHYSVSYITSSALDCASLIGSALEGERYGWLQRSGAVAELWTSSLMLLDTIRHSFGSVKSNGEQVANEADLERWRDHFSRALAVLGEAGISTTRDLESGAEKYSRLRAEWEPRVRALASSMFYAGNGIGPEGARNGGRGAGSRFETELRAR